MLTIMGIEAKRRGWEPGEIKIDVYKIMTSEGPRKIKTLILEIFMPFELDSKEYKILKSSAENCPVKLNLEACLEIKMNWHEEKILNR